jgi:5-methylcytosine-specific restriction endonuclease McrA
MFAKDVELHKAASKAYYAKNADKENARSIAWKQKNRSRANELKRQSWHKHAESNQEKLRVRYIGNKQYYLNQALLWQKQNPSKVAARTMRRNLAKIQRTPPWLGGDDHWMIEQAYELAALRTKMFGFVWHVDHIIPLRGKTVSGLHVPWNLQVIPGVENNRKGNRLMGNVS